FAQEPDNAPADHAAEAVKGLAVGVDVIRRRFFVMEWTERLESCAGAFQRKIRADRLDDVVGGGDLLYGFYWNHVGCLFFARLLSEAMPNLLSVGALSKQ